MLEFLVCNGTALLRYRAMVRLLASSANTATNGSKAFVLFLRRPLFQIEHLTHSENPAIKIVEMKVRISLVLCAAAVGATHL
jgi:hypothetical protein